MVAAASWRSPTTSATPARLAREMVEETRLYRQELRWVLEQMGDCLRETSPGRLHWRPATTANSAATVVHHVIGATRVYVLGFGCGQLVTRDREAEFVAEGVAAAALLAALEQVADEIDSALAAVTPVTLERRLRPAQELWGAVSETREISGGRPVPAVVQ